MRILFDKNVPVGVREFLTGHDVYTFADLGWHPQLENGKLLKAGEDAGFDVMITADQNIRFQQDLTDRKMARVVLCSNIWTIVRSHIPAIARRLEEATTGSYAFIEMPLPPRRSKRIE